MHSLFKIPCEGQGKHTKSFTRASAGLRAHQLSLESTKGILIVGFRVLKCKGFRVFAMMAIKGTDKIEQLAKLAECLPDALETVCRVFLAALTLVLVIEERAQFAELISDPALALDLVTNGSPLVDNHKDMSLLLTGCS
ncbi:hypothetical protein PPACK8108_LOCUS11667 [Phakopsora pachyrhizi]|uniref:Uncharacterized protein n=1 Tax=Phakopsora pachyrhizi TaxID=170000 RepID=A0AAV0B105_PHAPC|nr:hypothetical protein PPACK8108_LOCUS11667 [Phakopsora pachyrhizi]